MAVIGTGLSAKVYSALYTSQVSDANIVVSNSTTQGRTESVLDFNDGEGIEARDVETAFSWTISAGTILYTWQPTVIENPENTYNRATDWDNAGIPGNKLIRGFVLEMNTLGNAKAIQVQRAEDGSFFTPSESPATTSKQVLKAFSFNPPFVSHNVRITSTDGVAWQHGPDGGWKMSWIADPWVEYATLRSEWSDLGTQGAKYLRGLVLPMDTQGEAATIDVVTSDGGSVTFMATTSAAVKTPVSFAFVLPIVAHEVQIQVKTATAGVWLNEARWDFDPYPELTAEYTPIMEVGGSDNKYVRGINITADTANVAVAFQVLYDGGQTGPLTTATAFNGKKTVSFAFDPPFIAHDLQIVPQSSARIFLTESKWILDPWAEYTTVYSPWMNLGRQEPKYIRSLTIPLDTKGLSASLTVVSSDGASVSLSATTTAGVKTPVGFAFNPPIVAHEVQIRMNSLAAMWPEEAQWEADPYPEIIPAYTPIMEVSGSGAKLMRGLNITGDTANVSTSFVISYDGGQTGPTVTAVFNGKQTKAFAFNPPFIAHDIQLIPQANARIWVEESKWDMDPWPEYTALYSSWMNLGTNGAKYIRSLVLPMDTDGSSAVVNIVTSDGATIPLASTTTPSGVKTQVAFAFDPPFVAHELRFVPQNPVGLWSEEAKFEFDPYPEIIPAYTPIMEVSGDDNKFVQGVKLLADTGNLPVTFQVLYDGGQTGPTFTGTFNGKQTLIFSWTPFLAHDIQLVPQANARIWWGGVGQGESEWVSQPFSEAATIWQTELTSQGGVGWQHLRYINIEYISTNPITLTFVTDSGNGSIAPSTITVPSSGGTQTKLKITVSPNKWKLLSVGATSSTSFYLMTEGMEFYCRSWNSSESYRVEHPFGGKTSGGAEL